MADSLFTNALTNDKLGSLAKRFGKKAGGVRRRDETPQQFHNRMDGASNPGQDPNADINAIFQGIRSNRGMVRRNLDGSMADPNAPQGLDAFYAKNPHLRGAAERQAQYDQQAREALPGRLQSAVNERRAQQKMQNYNPNLVTGADGYRTIFDSKGGVIGTTKPVVSSTMWAKDNAINRGTATGAEQQGFKQALQDTGMSSVSSKQKSGPNGVDLIFGGRVSPPGGGSADGVGSAQTSGAPGGDLFGQVPGFESRGMPLRGIQFPPNAGPRYQPMESVKGIQVFPNTGPESLSTYSPEEIGPQRPAWLHVVPKDPFGTAGTNEVPIVRGLYPTLRQGVQEISATVDDFLNSVFGRPQTAYEKYKEQQRAYALEQYLNGLR